MDSDTIHGVMTLEFPGLRGLGLRGEAGFRGYGPCQEV